MIFPKWESSSTNPANEFSLFWLQCRILRCGLQISAKLSQHSSLQLPCKLCSPSDTLSFVLLWSDNHTGAVTVLPHLVNIYPSSSVTSWRRLHPLVDWPLGTHLTRTTPHSYHTSNTHKINVHHSVNKHTEIRIVSPELCIEPGPPQTLKCWLNIWTLPICDNTGGKFSKCLCAVAMEWMTITVSRWLLLRKGRCTTREARTQEVVCTAPRATQPTRRSAQAFWSPSNRFNT